MLRWRRLQRGRKRTKFRLGSRKRPRKRRTSRWRLTCRTGFGRCSLFLLGLSYPNFSRASISEIQAHHPTLVFDNLSPKLQTLVKLLGACKPGAETFCGIVFVNRRMDALLIAQIIKELTSIIPYLDWIKVDCVTGHGSSGDGGGAFGPRMAWSEQASVLTAFGEGETNLLIATSVVEEGLDVQPCRMGESIRRRLMRARLTAPSRTSHSIRLV